MYADPRKIKSNIVKVRLDERTNEQLDALVTLTGDQKAVITRRLVLLGIETFHAGHDADTIPAKEVAYASLMKG